MYLWYFRGWLNFVLHLFNIYSLKIYWVELIKIEKLTLNVKVRIWNFSMTTKATDSIGFCYNCCKNCNNIYIEKISKTIPVIKNRRLYFSKCLFFLISIINWKSIWLLSDMVINKINNALEAKKLSINKTMGMGQWHLYYSIMKHFFNKYF